jgi:hypothetical protein
VRCKKIPSQSFALHPLTVRRNPIAADWHRPYTSLATFIIHLKKCQVNETYSKVHIGKYLSDTFPIQNGLKQGDALPPLLSNLL